MEILFVLGLIAIVWLVVAIPIYKTLRTVLVRNSESVTRRFLFIIICGTIVAPGLLSLGHPPPISSPGAALLGLVYLSQILRGQTSEDSFFFAYGNLASWTGVTACIGISELWRLRQKAYLIREAAVIFTRDVIAGLRTGKPKWVIPGVCIAAAIPAFFVVNGPVGEPTRRQGRVIACGPHVHWLTRIETPFCSAELSDGSFYSFQEPDYFNRYGHVVTILRFQRRFVGTHDVVLKE